MTPFTVKDWKDYPLTTTPITAAALEDQETRLSAYTDTGDAALDTRLDSVESGGVFGWVHVDAHGAVGDGTTDDTAAFNTARTAAGAGGTILCGAKTYRLDDFKPLTRQTLRGAGQATVLKAKTGAARVLNLEGLYWPRVAELKIDGNAKASDGIRVAAINAGADAQGASFDHVYLQNCDSCFDYPDPGTPDQADKNSYWAVQMADSNVGLDVVSPNAQHHDLLGCSMDGMGTCMKLAAGTVLMLGGQMQNADTDNGTMVEFTSAGVDWVHMVDVITEGYHDGFIATGAYWPLLGVKLDGCVIEAYNVIADIDRGGTAVMLKAERTRFLRGAINLQGDDSAFYKEFCTLATGATVARVGANTHLVEIDGNEWKLHQSHFHLGPMHYDPSPAAGQAALATRSGALSVFGLPFKFPTYTTATIPAAAGVPAGSVIYVSDGVGGSKLQLQDGGAWVDIGFSEAWHVVGGGGEPAFTNSWVNYTAGTNAVAAFYKDRAGIVRIKGFIKDGTIGQAAFTLPVGYRPSEDQLFATVSNGAFGYVSVAAAGTVTPAVGNNTWASLAGFTFRV